MNAGQLMIAVLSLLLFHGLLGGADVILNHELGERLPSRVSARKEQALHSMREFIFTILFGTLAWLQWGGELIWGVVLLLVLEFAVSLRDTLLEDQTRRLPALERTMHVLLFINFGAYSVLLGFVLADWHAMPNRFEPTYYGPLSWALSALAAASLCWSVRDGLASVALHRQARKAGASSRGSKRMQLVRSKPHSNA